jgi:hypothetical protein
MRDMAQGIINHTRPKMIESWPLSCLRGKVALCVSGGPASCNVHRNTAEVNRCPAPVTSSEPGDLGIQGFGSWQSLTRHKYPLSSHIVPQSSSMGGILYL